MAQGVAIKKVNSLLRELNLGTMEEVVKDCLFTELLHKIASFRRQIDYFSRKYNAPFEKFKKEYENSEEDFKKYDDLMAWEFAIEGFNYWNKKLEELKSVL